MILVTGATGKLGGQVIEQLVRKVSAGQIVAGVRDPGKAADLARLGVHVRLAVDACAGASAVDHQRALDAMALYAPLIELTSVDEVLASL